MDGRPLVAQLRAAHVLTAASLLAACFLVPTVQAAYGPNGLTISGIGAASYAGPAVVADAQGGYFVAWHDSVSGSGGDIRLQHVSAVGTPLASNLAITNDASALSAPVMTSDGAGGVVLAWIGGTNWVFAQHVSANNSALWTANGVRVTTDNHDELRPAIAGDGSGGAVVAWEDHRGSKASIFVQDMTSLSGGRSWGDASVAMDTSATDDRLAPRIAADGAGGAVLCWDDFDGSAYHTTVRRVLAGGAVTWPAPIVVGGSNERKALLACDGSANTFVAWNKPSTGTSGLYVEKLDGNGGTVWSGARVDGAAAGLAPYGLWPESGGGLLLLYSDLTLLRAQELSSSGTPQPLALSLQPSQPITGVGGATDGGTGIFASWTQNDGQAYARHVVSVSGGLRTPLRTMTTIASTSRQLPSAQMLTSGDFVAAWSDVAVDTTIVAQRMSPAGTMGDYHHVTTDVTGAGRITSAASAVDSLNGVFYAATGSSVTFRARSTSGGTYLDSLFVDAEFFGPAPNYTFTAISADSALRASFSSQPYAQTIVTRAFQYVPVGFPMTPNPSSPVTLFASIGTEGSGTWRLGRWNPVVPHYVEPPDSLTAIAAGAGYWLGTAKPETLTVSGAPVAEADFVLPLAPAAAADSGWNQIADPFRFPVAVADLYVGAGGAPVALTSGGNTLTDPMVLSAATSGSPVAVSVMHPDTAYWIWRRPGNGNVKLTFPYTFDASADLTAPLSPPASAWSIGLDVRGASQDASHLEVGAAGAA
ncbi:MAG TPA: hypothetical protein VMI75_12605, partial [Polyangiaceae bacterium]|nr:hypothetical protein [Polyangiaceae bacterium]